MRMTKNWGLRKPILATTVGSVCPGRDQVYKVFIPTMMGSAATAISGKVRLPASRMRRITSAQRPPVRCCTMRSAVEPSVIPKQKRNATRYAWKNSTLSAMAAATQTATTTAPAAPTFMCRPSNFNVVSLVSIISICPSFRPSFRMTCQFRAFVVRHIGNRHLPAKLQRAHVGNNGPAVRHRYAIGVGIHHSKAIGDYIKIMPHRSGPQSVLMKRRRMPEAALHDHAVSIARKSVTWRAKHVVAFTAAFHDL